MKRSAANRLLCLLFLLMTIPVTRNLSTAHAETQEAGSASPLLAAIAGLVPVAYQGGRR